MGLRFRGSGSMAADDSLGFGGKMEKHMESTIYIMRSLGFRVD